MIFVQQTKRLFLVVVVALCLSSPAQAAIVSQLNIQKIKITLAIGGNQVVAQSAQGGTIVMGVFQPPSPPIMDNFSGNGHTFSLFTQPGPAGFPAPSATVDASQITVDLRSLFAKVSGNLIPGGSGFMNIGPQLDNVMGTYDSVTGDFMVSWVHLFDPNQAFLDGIDVAIDGHANVTPAPLPASALFFGTGLAGLAGLFRKKRTLGGNVVR